MERLLAGSAPQWNTAQPEAPCWKECVTKIEWLGTHHVNQFVVPSMQEDTY